MMSSNGSSGILIPVTCAFVDLYKAYGPTLNLVASSCFEFKYDNNESDDGTRFLDNLLFALSVLFEEMFEDIVGQIMCR